MRRKTAALVLTAGLVTGGGAALFAPGLASAADSTPAAGPADRAASRLTAIKDALKGLVSDGTLDQAQADKVASTLSQADLGGGRGHGPGGGRVSPEATAKVIGITVDQLRTAEQSGQTLAQIAQAHGVSRTALIDGLVAAAKAQLAADVTAGRITQAQADTATSTLTARITDRVDRVGGRGHGGGPGAPGDQEGAPAPSAPAPAPSATS